MMIRLKKTMLLGLAVLAIGAQSVVGDAAWAAAKTRIQIAHGASEGYHMHRALVLMKDELDKTGRFDVRIFPSSQFGNDTEMIETVTTGDLDIVLSPSSFFTTHSKRMNLIELPYVFPSRKAAIDVLGGAWGKKALAELDGSGLVGIGFMENGLRHLSNNKHEVVHPADLQGLKLRTMQVPAHVEFWNLTGASASGSPFPELYTNLSTGVFDGQENPIAHIYTQKFYEVQKYLTLTGHVYTAYIAAANKAWWDGLSAQDQQDIQAAFDRAYAYQLQLIDEEESRQLDEMKAKGLQVTTLNPEQVAEWMAVAAPLNKKYAGQVGQDLYDEFMTAIAAASGQ